MILLCSCSKFSSKRSSSDKLTPEITKSLKNICFDSTGKGRVNVGKEKYLFHYQSQFVDGGKKWGLAIRLPLFGEEVLFIDQTSLPPKLSGNFYHRIRGSFAKNPWGIEKVAAQDFFDQMGVIVRLAKEGNQFCEENPGQCGKKNGGPRFLVNEEILQISTEVNGKYIVRMKNWNLEDGYYHRMNWSLLSKNMSSSTPLMSWDLFVKSCSN